MEHWNQEQYDNCKIYFEASKGDQALLDSLLDNYVNSPSPKGSGFPPMTYERIYL